MVPSRDHRHRQLQVARFLPDTTSRTDAFTVDWLQLFSTSHAQISLAGTASNMADVDHNGMTGFAFQVRRHLLACDAQTSATVVFERVQKSIYRQLPAANDREGTTPEIVSTLSKELRLCASSEPTPAAGAV